MASLQTLKPIVFEVQQACRQLSLGVPTGVFDSLDETAQVMGAVANLAGILLADSFEWQHLQETFTVNGDGVTTEFALPDDFAEFVNNTGWSQAIRRPVVILNNQQWAAIASWLSSSFFVNPACRINDDVVQFMSAPPEGTVTFQYRSKNWIIDGLDPTMSKNILDNNADVPKFDWLMMTLAIKTKWLELKGMNTIAAQSDLNDRYLQLTQKDELSPVLVLSGPSPGTFRYLDNFYNTPDTNIG